MNRRRLERIYTVLLVVGWTGLILMILWVAFIWYVALRH